jgi:hypothetical protein
VSAQLVVGVIGEPANPEVGPESEQVGGSDVFC